jgi:hypothetical protein
LDIHAAIIDTTTNKQMNIHISFKDLNCKNAEIVEHQALIDSGAGGKFIHWKFVRRNKITQKPLKRPQGVKNVDGTSNKQGTISHYVVIDLKTGD